MSESSLIYINGEFKTQEEAKISVLDQGFLLGDAVFDVVSVWKGYVFKLDEHIKRFQDSLKATRLNSSMNKLEWSEAIIKTVKLNKLKDASVRFIATRGIAREVIADPRVNYPTEIIWAAPYIFLADEKGRKEGIRLMVSHLRGFSPDTLDPRYKCVDRLHYQLAKMEALDAGYDDLIWLDNNGYVAEGPASNIFVIKDGIIYTPGDSILRGITRQVFIDLAKKINIEVKLCNISTFDLFSADEIFTTSTAGGALPIKEVSGRKLNGDVPGKVTRKLDDLYWQLREKGTDGTAVY